MPAVQTEIFSLSLPLYLSLITLPIQLMLTIFYNTHAEAVRRLFNLFSSEINLLCRSLSCGDHRTDDSYYSPQYECVCLCVCVCVCVHLCVNLCVLISFLCMQWHRSQVPALA